MARGKKPAFVHAPKGGRDARNLEPRSNDSDLIGWHLSTFDHDGPWGSHQFDRDTFRELLRDKIKSFESMTWRDIKRGGDNHGVAVEKLIKRAQDRLEELRLDDIDELFSLRCTGRQRIWGIEVGAILRLLWWDPNHEICPAPKKHT